MMLHANGTDAKDIALYFLTLIHQKPSENNISKTIVQVKRLMQSGYTKKQIIDVIDFHIKTKRRDVYSFGFINTVMEDTLEQLRASETIEEVQEQLASVMESQRNEVITDEQSTQRNRNKLDRFGVQSRFREKFALNLPEGD